ncbi:hypothetical protein GFGA_1c1138 [Gluconobacter frateurii NBRC 103465]|nr:hypothetical protein GFGA_1c1138 [Gluconobacter frateurii NBRC 103465]
MSRRECAEASDAVSMRFGCQETQRLYDIEDLLSFARTIRGGGIQQFLRGCSIIFFGYCHGYGPMEAAALRRYPLLEKAGLISLDPNDAQSLRRFIRIARDVLEQGNVLWITPQGEFADSRDRPIRLQAGFAHLVRHVPSARLVPLAIEYPFWNESQPELLLRFGAPMPVGIGEGVRSVTSRMEEALTQTMDALAQDACTRDASRFTTFTQGQAGIGGLYDIGRRVRQWARRESFQPRHDP